MTARALLAGCLFAELAVAALLGVAVVVGRFDDAAQVGALLAAVAGVAALAGWRLSTGRLGRIATHGALLSGCLVFAFPFAWLVGTSMKYDEEIFVYPPRWLPQWPQTVGASPYVSAGAAGGFERPQGMSARRWAVLWPRIEAAIWAHARDMVSADLASRLEEGTLRVALGPALYAAAAPGVARSAWAGDDAALVAALVGRIDQAAVDEVWSAIYRSVELRPPVVRDVYHGTHRADGSAGWRLRSGAADLLAVASGGSAQLLTYDFSAAEAVELSGEFALPVTADEFLSFTLPLRQDRSWHGLQVALELDGKRYVAADALYLGQYRWQEMSFKIAALDDRDERELGIWPLVLAADQTAVFAEAGAFRVVLRVERAGALATGWRKYTHSYREAYIATEHRWAYIFNSLYLALLTIVGQVFSCSLVAYAFARLQWPGRELWFGILLATMMLPGQVTMIPVFMIFRALGWYNTLKALWVPSFFGSAFFIFMLRQFMKGIPRDLEEAAKIDGCSFFGIYWRIILPLIKPALAAVAIFTFMNTWNDFMGPLIYINDQRLYPLALGLFDFRSEHSSEYGMLMAASTLMTLPVIAIFFLAQRYFIQGVTLTGMKG